ncbi:MAG: exopolysaccharide biosynthesis polyprenyl glycosylphosphotransferase [Myxococcaceae bacterium]|nr:exopolysaccharide biosynthesis polyprenyl glycosylphosphotransferase [Myxococcaceae bacterium]
MLRVFHHYVSGRKLVFFLMEGATIALACVGGALACVWARSPGQAITGEGGVLVTLLVLALGHAFVLQAGLYFVDLYDLRVAGEDRGVGLRLLKAAGLATVVVALLALTAATVVLLPGGALMGCTLGALVGALAARTALPIFTGEPVRVLVLGDGAKARAVAASLETGGEGAWCVVGGVAPGESVAAAALRLGTQHVVMAHDDAREGDIAPELLRCRLAGLEVYDAAMFCERALRRIPVGMMQASHFAFADELRWSPLRRMMKRTFDLVVAGTVFLLALPLAVLVALVIKLDSRGPVFYRQERVGTGGRTFRLWKFRSMQTDAEKDGAVWARTHDERVTRVGRLIRLTRVDELPQVLNVLAGDMSFVGPRPERPVFMQLLKEAIPFYGLREAVKPGITGWAQIRYPYGASVEDARNKLEYDLYYVKNGSLFLDLSVIFHTARHVLTGRGAR